MWMVAGLGNPGPEYESTRHNAGFMVVDELGRRLRAGPFRKRFDSLYLRARFQGEEILFVKPLSFMNLSGGPVRAWLSAMKLPPSCLIVVHDDLDLPLGRLKVVGRGGHGGHRGVLSIQEELGTSEFIRVKVGIGRPPAGLEPTTYVLTPFSEAEAEGRTEAVRRAADAVEVIIAKGLSAAMNYFNVRGQSGCSMSDVRKVFDT